MIRSAVNLKASKTWPSKARYLILAVLTDTNNLMEYLRFTYQRIQTSHKQKQMIPYLPWTTQANSFQKAKKINYIATK